MYVSVGKNHIDMRVDVIPSPSLKERYATIRYDGILKNSGADRIFVHYGFDGWREAATAEMRRDPDGSFVSSIQMKGDKHCDFCFKDSANNWDNNGGWNWRTDIRH